MQKIHLYLIALMLLLAVSPARAQNPAPAPAQEKPIALMNGIAHLGNGEVIPNAVITFRDGKIETVADATRVRLNLDGYEVISIEGQHVYPGFILPYTNLGLVEVDAVRATIDEAEVGEFNPNVRSLIAYNTDSQIIPTVRSNGILLAQVAPRGGVISGSSSVVQLDAWNWEDAVVQEDGGIWLNWPSIYRRTGWWAEPGPIEMNKEYDKRVGEIKQFMDDAKAYAEGTPATINLKLEAMKGLFDGSKKLYIRADNAKEIVEGIKTAQQYSIPEIVVAGAEDAWLVKDFLKDNKIPVLLANVHRLPARPEEDIDMPYKLAGMLHDEGILVGLLYDDLKSNRNLPFFAGTTAAYGLDKEQALQLITSNTAKILGIEDVAGTLEPGKSATLFISEGDALDMRTNKVTQAFIQGRDVNLHNKQKELYKKYKDKYEAGK
ncbi:amidohydrolase family protein [Nafulsella turpanensis]|uniref:amidohydrolase family protein n=1 Tax=Nafulsella turpanensis TaxID=1265690 RepID=UPI000344E45A|nr:amidohydrolase family protein [Nafulsella turpanensis]